jgi:hypothetical protein
MIAPSRAIFEDEAFMARVREKADRFAQEMGKTIWAVVDVDRSTGKTPEYVYYEFSRRIGKWDQEPPYNPYAIIYVASVYDFR